MRRSAPRASSRLLSPLTLCIRRRNCAYEAQGTARARLPVARSPPWVPGMLIGPGVPLIHRACRLGASCCKIPVPSPCRITPSHRQC